MSRGEERSDSKRGRDWILFWTAVAAITGVVIAVFTVVPAFGVHFDEVPAVFIVALGAGALGTSGGVLITLWTARASSFQSQMQRRAFQIGSIALLVGVILLGLGIGKASTILPNQVAGATRPQATLSPQSSASAGPSSPAPQATDSSSPTQTDSPSSVGALSQLPSAYVGTWRGTISFDPPQPTNMSKSYAVVVTLKAAQVGDTVGSSQYPTYNGGGSGAATVLLNQVVGKNSVVIAETGNNYLNLPAQITLQLVDDHTIQWTATYSYQNNWHTSGQLIKSP
jgi:hypothetical protein